MDALAVVQRLGGKNLIPELADALKATKALLGEGFSLLRAAD